MEELLKMKDRTKKHSYNLTVWQVKEAKIGSAWSKQRRNSDRWLKRYALKNETELKKEGHIDEWQVKVINKIKNDRIWKEKEGKAGGFIYDCQISFILQKLTGCWNVIPVRTDRARWSKISDWRIRGVGPDKRRWFRLGKLWLTHRRLWCKLFVWVQNGRQNRIFVVERGGRIGMGTIHAAHGERYEKVHCYFRFL